MQFTKLAERILKARYLQEGETATDMFRRVAKAIASVEAEENRAHWENTFFDLMNTGMFLPNSPTLFNAGVPGAKQNYSACYVISPEDSLLDIFNTLHDAAMIFQSGGGVGYSFSKLRPKNSSISGNGGRSSGPCSFMRLFDTMTDVVRQGGKRRGANMSVLSCTHPDILEFIHLKEQDGIMSTFNISVSVTDAFMEAVERGSAIKLIEPHTGKIVQTIAADKIFNDICIGLHKNGEPGLIFIDTINRDNPVPARPIEAVNPCVVGSTRVRTAGGCLTIKELAEKDDQTIPAFVEGKCNQPTPVTAFSTGIKEVYKVSTKEGYSVTATADHKVLVREGASKNNTWKAVNELAIGDKLQLAVSSPGGFSPSGEGKYFGELLGWCIADGYLSVKEERAYWAFYPEKTELFKYFLTALSSVTGVPHTTKLTGAKVARLSSKPFYDKLKKMLPSGVDKHDFIVLGYTLSQEGQAGLLSALFTADGTVLDNRDKGSSIRLCSVNLPMLECVQQLLLNFGIVSKIYKNRRHGKNKAFLPDGRGGSKEYPVQETHELVISKAAMYLFRDKIGFMLKTKQEKLISLLDNYKEGCYRSSPYATVEAITPVGMEDVYDITEPATHSFVANGIVVHNCSESLLSNYESCNLGSIDLHKWATLKSRDEQRNIIYAALRFLDNIIDAQQYTLPKIERATKETRKVGLGFMGLHAHLLSLGLPYSKAGLDGIKEVFENFETDAEAATIRLGKEKGMYPLYTKGMTGTELSYRIQVAPKRNALTTLVAPTGSLSLLANTSSGVEPIFSLVGTRSFDGEEYEYIAPFLQEYLEANYSAHKADILAYAKEHGTLVGCVWLPEKHAKLWKIATEISWQDHIEVQAEVQKYVNGAISKTINMPESATVEDVKAAVLMAYKLGCKSITLYRDHSRAGQVFDKSASNANTVNVDSCKDAPQNSSDSAGRVGPSRVEFPAPIIYTPTPREEKGYLSAEQGKFRTGCGKGYLLPVKMGDRAFASFIVMGKAGGCQNSQNEALGRAMSMALRYGCPPERLAHQLQGIRCPKPIFHNGQPILSCADAIGKALAGLFQVEDKVAEVIAKEAEAGCEICPDCSTELVPDGHCKLCPNCGYSRCF